jgi:hypothetical protein
VKWFSPEGVVVSNERTLEIMNIQESAAGTYTCAVIRIVTGATINSTAVNVTVQFFRPPVVTGNTTISKGDTLYLDCDASNSRPRPSVEWLSPEGVVVSYDTTLEIMNIQESAAGTYTCVVIRFVTGATINSTAVNVTGVQ